ncbi:MULTISPECIES: MarR family winged helix-turn-helix transcriptional regulator [Streptomyces]|uniref:MarR family winged helix-turn-helix transcriptional regulator n=1 Tax=Streptomyces TaxID=1883 RepID=UPI001CEDB4EF|nr:MULTISPECIES: MarR family winged helix-turn-helix transcriptional regulator [Streptomyces]MCX4617306.1 MarR family winged helix-turn-helix transcriptional regulator [Streptomyces mirabilis]
MSETTRDSTSAARVAAAIGTLTLRATRAGLYGRLTSGVEGVDATTYPVLSGLARVGPVTATKLAEAIGMDRTVTTRYASRLQEAGLVARRPDPADARATRLVLTVEGEQAVMALRGAMESFVAEEMATWPSGEAAAFAIHLERLTESLAQGEADRSR